MLHSAIIVDRAAIAAVCRSFGVERLSAFGSALREDFDSDRSDLDLLVDFQPQVRVSLFTLVEMEWELSGLFGRKVDLVTSDSLSKYFRDEVVALAEPLYVAP
ncbi:MAG: nucleotidyltransferase domain-containing protein [Pirellulales bacterium]|nr:nucleotidyltransferase domain-containing protein [Pirellulales bacterium]